MPYLWGFLFFLFLLGFPFFVLVVANKQDGWLKITGWILSGVFVLILIISSLFSLVATKNSGPWMFDRIENLRDHSRFNREGRFQPNVDEKTFFREWLRDPEHRNQFKEMFPELDERWQEKMQGYPILPHPEFEAHEFKEMNPFDESVPFPSEEEKIMKPPTEPSTP
jgi:hypothetical protein